MTLFDALPPPEGEDDRSAVRRDPSHTWSVPELHGRLEDALSNAIPHSVWVEGEITNLSRASNGHVYFTLVEPGEDHRSPGHALSVTLFRWQKEKVNLQLKRAGGAVKMDDGVRVRVRGDLELYGRRMQVQLKMFAIDPAFTLGDLAARRQALLARLDAEGLLGANRRLALGPLPLRVGLVTSAGSAAHADFLHELEVSGLGFDVLCVDARVQGVESEATVAAAISTLQHHRVDVIALVRGGGARTDLAAFDSEVIARSIAASGVVVWSGIGHETDRSVADEVVHTAWKTPTACAAALVEAVRLARDRAEGSWERVLDLAAAQLETHAARHDRRARSIASSCRVGLDRAASDMAHRRARVVRDASQLLRSADARLERARGHLGPSALRRLDAAADRVELLAAQVRAEDPARLLERGWSITHRADGTVLRSTVDALPGEHLVTTIVDGTVHSTVDPEGEPT